MRDNNIYESVYVNGKKLYKQEYVALLVAKLEIAEKALRDIRKIDWGTDHCDKKNMLADRALEKLRDLED